MGGVAGLLRRNRDFRRLFGAQVVALGGDWFAVISVLVFLHQLPGGALWGGLVLGTDAVVVALVAPAAGVVADRCDRRVILMLATVGSAAAIALLFAVRSAGGAWIALTAVGATAIGKGFYSPVFQASLPNVVDADDLQIANLLSGGVWGAMLAIGASVGGFLGGALGIRMCCVIDVGCMLLAAALIGRVHRPLQVRGAQRVRLGGGALRPCLRFVRTSPRVRALVTVKSAVALGNGPLALFPLIAVLDFRAGAAGMGLLYACRGLGVVVGPVLLRRALLRAGRLLPGFAIGMAVYGLAYVAFGFVDSLWLALALVVLAHCAGGANWVLSSFALQQEVPDDLRGRVFGIDVMLATLSFAVSQVSAGALADRLPAQLVAALCGVVTLSYGAIWAAATAPARRASSGMRGAL